MALSVEVVGLKGELMLEKNVVDKVDSDNKKIKRKRRKRKRRKSRTRSPRKMMEEMICKKRLSRRSLTIGVPMMWLGLLINWRTVCLARNKIKI